MNKRFAFVLVFVLASSSLIVVKPVQSEITNPSVPEFSLKYIDLSYDVPPTYGIDQFTGENVTTHEGYHVDKRSITFKIKNQPFASYNDSSGNVIGLYYNFRFKGQYGNWQNYPFSDNGEGTRRYSAGLYVFSYESPKISTSNSEYTDVTLSLPFLFGYGKPPVGSPIDFQVQALIGYIDGLDGWYHFTGQASDWSSTQTITAGESTSTATPTPSPSQSTPTQNESASPSQSPTATPDQSSIESTTKFELNGVEIAILIVLIVIAALLSVSIALRLKKKQ